MSPEKSLSRYILVILSVSVVFTALVIVALNAYVSNKKLSESNGGSFINNALSSFSYDDGYRDGYKAARERFGVAPNQILSVNGVIQDLDLNNFMIIAENLDTDEFVDSVSDKRNVLINASTTILMRVPLSKNILDKKLNAWSNSADRDTTPPPTPYEEKSLTISDLKNGQKVTVVAYDDIRLAEAFDAQTIIIITDVAE